VVPVSGGVVTPSVQPLAAMKLLMPAEMFVLYSAQDPYAAFAKAVGKTPVWIFHGGQDDTVNVSEEVLGRQILPPFPQGLNRCHVIFALLVRVPLQSNLNDLIVARYRTMACS
jgi:hypothetical protein